MELLPKSQRERHIVVAFLLVITAVLVISRVSLTPDTQNVAKDIADSFITTILVTLVLALLWRFLDLNSKYNLESRILYPSEIGDELASGAKSATEWEYRGGCGRYQRFEVLPMLAKTATQSGLARYAYIEIIDPSDSNACRGYAEYRNKRRSGQGKWSATRVRLEVLATIFVAYNYSKKANLEIQLYLANTFSLFRIDLNEKYVVVTQEDDKLPALKLVAASHYYRELTEDLRLSRAMCKQVNMRQIAGEVANLDTLKEAAEKLMVSLDGLSTEEFDELLEMIKSPKSPY